MMAIQELKAIVAQGWEPHIGDMCSQVIDRLVSLPKSQAQRLTYKLIARFAGREPTDSELQTVITILTSVDHHPLVMEFAFYDEEDDREILVSASYALRSVEEKEFIHPRTGELVPDFDEKLRPVFKPSDEFYEWLKNDEK